MTHDRIINEYYEWLFDMVCGEKERFNKLLSRLHDIPFRYSIPRDENRAIAGTDLRWRFALAKGYEEYADEILDILAGPCSVLELIVAIAIYCEEHVMDDPEYGDRTCQWFWGMIINLGLGSMLDYRFDERYVDDVIERFLDRDYEPDGRGGLFTIKNCNRDLRDVEIFHQMCWYLGSIT